MVLPVSQVSSTTSTRRPLMEGGGPGTRIGCESASFRVTTIEVKSHCRIEATTTPGMTPALAMPSTISGWYSRATRSASARQSSPKNGQSTSSTPRELGALRRMRFLLSERLTYPTYPGKPKKPLSVALRVRLLRTILGLPQRLASIRLCSETPARHELLASH